MPELAQSASIHVQCKPQRNVSAYTSIWNRCHQQSITHLADVIDGPNFNLVNTLSSKTLAGFSNLNNVWT